MTVLTAFAATSDDTIDSTGASMAIANAGSGVVNLLGVAQAFLIAGQDGSGGTKHAYQACFEFDTSPIGATGNPTSSVLSIWPTFSQTPRTDVLNCYDKAWGAAVDIADFIPQATLAGLPVLATRVLNGIGSGAYAPFTESGNALSLKVNKTGLTQLLLASAGQAANSSPTLNEDLQFAAADTAGTSNDPKLVVTYSLPQASPFPSPRARRILRRNR